MYRLIISVGIAAAICFAVGCGGGSDETAGDTAAAAGATSAEAGVTDVEAGGTEAEAAEGTDDAEAADAEGVKAEDGLTKAEYIKEADALCSNLMKEREAAIAAWQKEYPGGAAKAEEDFDAGLKEVIAPALDQKADELETLAVPAGDEAAVTQMIGTLRNTSAVLAEEGSKGTAKSGAPQFEKEAAAYGFKVCRYP